MSALVQIGRRSSDEEGRQQRIERWSHHRGVQLINAQVYLENRCHLKCAHCYETETSHPHVQGLSLDEYRDVFAQLKTLGALTITFTGGEIFLRRDCLDIVAEARRQRFAVTLLTSGTLIDEDKASRIAALQCEVHISVYSHDAAVHDGFTGIPRSWERSVRGLRLLAERGVRTVMKANLMTINVDHIDELMALATSVGADYQFDPSVKPKMNGDRSPLRFAVPPERLQHLVYSRPDLYAAFRRNEPGGYCTGEKSFMDDDTVMCGAGRGLISVAADGGIHACGFYPVAAGHVRDQSIADIWFGSKLLEGLRDTTRGEMEACSSCGVKSTCSPCMAYSAVEHDGDHRQCATSSRQVATSVRLLAESRVRKDGQMSRGRLLPLVGDLEVPRPATKGVPPLSTE
jgi:AdoMet-dependent heme synthase